MKNIRLTKLVKSELNKVTGGVNPGGGTCSCSCSACPGQDTTLVTGTYPSSASISVGSSAVNGGGSSSGIKFVF